MNDERLRRAIVGALLERDSSGYEIWRWVGPIHGSSEALSEAVLYPLLYAMEAEGLIESRWSEGERTRRVYRIAAAGAREAADRQWARIARPRLTRDALLAAPDESPSFVFRDRDVPHAAEPPGNAASRRGAVLADPAAIEAADAADATAAAPGVAQGLAAVPPPGVGGEIAAFLDELESALRLGEYHRHDVRNEIADHLADSSAMLVSLGRSPGEAETEAVDRLGSPRELARAINAAQLTRKRLAGAVRSATWVALLSLAVSLVLGGSAIIIVSPFLATVVVEGARFVGLHLFVAATAAWRSELIGLSFCLGAFMAGRQSIGQLALRSRRSEASIWPLWGAAGAIPLALVALLLPFELDALAVASLLFVPVSFVVGTLRPSGLHEDAISPRGVVAAAIIVGVLALLPAIRLFAFDPAASGPAGLPPLATATDAGGGPGQAAIVWTAVGDNKQWDLDVQGVDSGRWADVEVEMWPAVRRGVFVEPDPAAPGPAWRFVPGDRVNFSQLGAVAQEWWTALTATGPDGRRHTLQSGVHVGAPANHVLSVIDELLHR